MVGTSPSACRPRRRYPMCRFPDACLMLAQTASAFGALPASTSVGRVGALARFGPGTFLERPTSLSLATRFLVTCGRRGQNRSKVHLFWRVIPGAPGFVGRSNPSTLPAMRRRTVRAHPSVLSRTMAQTEQTTRPLEAIRAHSGSPASRRDRSGSTQSSPVQRIQLGASQYRTLGRAT